MSLTKLSLVGKNKNYSWESLISDIPAGDGKMANLFYSVGDSSKVKKTGQIVKTQTKNNIFEKIFP
jgi:hypothetical protein